MIIWDMLAEAISLVDKKWKEELSAKRDNRAVGVVYSPLTIS